MANPRPSFAQAKGLQHPSWATPARFMGRVAADQQIALQVHLQMRNPAAAAAELAAISDPRSPRYGQFLTDAQYDAKYRPTDADVAAVRAHLEGQGLRVTAVPSDHAYLAATGSVAAVERAFSTELGNYRVGDTVRRAPVTAPRLPAGLDARVLTVLGLSSPVAMKPSNVVVGGIHRNALFSKLHPHDTAAANTCSEWYGAAVDTSDPAYGDGWPALAYAPCGYRPAQVRKAYGFADSVRKGNDGTGISVAIVDAYLSPTLLKDAQTYAANNDPEFPLDPSQLVTLMGPGNPSPVDTGWYGEETLDVEAVHAMAPGAKIVVVGAQSAYDQDLVGAINLIVEQRLASIVSNSYGMIEAQGNDFVVWHALATQAGLKGIGLYFSSGDSGDEAQGLFGGSPSPDFPASLDNATAVGGTSLALGATGDRLWELGWETGASWLQVPGLAADGGAGDVRKPALADADGGVPTWDPAAPGQFVFGSGGGTSYVYAQPTWQTGIVPAALANLPGAPARVVPDVAMLADPITGFLIGQSDDKGHYQESAIGGTSLACPLFAGTMALAEQNAGRHFGFANVLLYRASTQQAFSDVFAAPTPQAVAIPGGVVATFDYPNLAIRTAPGYDNVTGLGTPNGQRFLDALK